MSLPDFNSTQQGQIFQVLFKSTTSSGTPLLLLESFMLGIFGACIPLASYLFWVRPHSFPRTPFISTLWLILTVTIIHWALSLRQFRCTLTGCSLEISPTVADFDSSFVWGSAWQVFLPIVTETVLSGFASFLFAATICTCFWPMRSQRHSWFSLTIPAMASLMYTLSLTHLAISLRFFILRTISATHDDWLYPVIAYVLDAVLLTVFSLNVVMSDTVVLWRMCVVWERSRPALRLAAAMIVVTLGLNVTNIVVRAREMLDIAHLVAVAENEKDSEVISTYGRNYVGIAAAFMSLASNLCATTLVGIKAWQHRRHWRHFSKQLQSAEKSPRTFVQRVLELLVESGIVYTAIWVLYCVSFFRAITEQDLFGSEDANESRVTAVAHLDAAMAQITSIYPLMIFLLVTLDKIHHSRGPQSVRNNLGTEQRIYAVTFDIDVERSVAQDHGSTHPMAVL